MGTFDLARRVNASPRHTFEVFSDFANHGDFIPLTTMITDSHPMGVGWRFTGRTGLGPLALVDKMVITVWDPPHEFRIEKLGPMVDGWAHVHFSAEGTDTRVVWRERIVARPAPVGRGLAPVLDPLNRRMFGRALDKMADRAARSAPTDDRQSPDEG
ncbi:MAG: SRPBCC family protein [Ornithinimicrobium sp.]